MKTFTFRNVGVFTPGIIEIESVKQEYQSIRLKINKIKIGNFIAKDTIGTICFRTTTDYVYVSLKEYQKIICIPNQKFIDWVWKQTGSSCLSPLYTYTTYAC